MGSAPKRRSGFPLPILGLIPHFESGEAGGMMMAIMLRPVGQLRLDLPNR
jgi:hypothetical protein